MNELVKVLPNFNKFESYITDIKNNTSPIMLSGLTDSAKVHFAYSTHFYAEKPICIITYNEMQARKLIKDMTYFTDKIEYFPKREITSFDYVAESKEITNKRIATLNNVINKKANVIITTIEAVSQKMIDKNELYKNTIDFKVGETKQLEEVKAKLLSLGYERCELVEAIGQYSIRGGILDIGTSEDSGVRIEFWGDEIDSIRIFNIQNQRSDEMIKKIKIYPAHEFVLEKPLEKVALKIQNEEDKEQILSGDYISKIDKYFNKFYDNQQTFIDYVSDDYIIFLDEISKIKARNDSLIKDNDNLMKSLIEKRKDIPEALMNLGSYVDFINRIDKKQTIYIEKLDIGFVDGKNMHAKRNGYSFSYREVNFFRSSMASCIEEVQEAIRKQKRVIVLGGSKENCQKLSDLFSHHNIINCIENDKHTIPTTNNQQLTTIMPGALSSGFECYDFDLLVITGEELFASTHVKRRPLSAEFKQGETLVFSDLKIGDYVVHRVNGIGQFVGVNTIKADNIVKDYIKIKYAKDGVLYIPTNNLDSIRKYIGTGDKAPKLNRLGSKEWANAKAKVKGNLQEIAKNLIELYAKRRKRSWVQLFTRYRLAKTI